MVQSREHLLGDHSELGLVLTLGEIDFLHRCIVLPLPDGLAQFRLLFNLGLAVTTFSHLVEHAGQPIWKTGVQHSVLATDFPVSSLDLSQTASVAVQVAAGHNHVVRRGVERRIGDPKARFAHEPTIFVQRTEQQQTQAACLLGARRQQLTVGAKHLFSAHHAATCHARLGRTVQMEPEAVGGPVLHAVADILAQHNVLDAPRFDSGSVTQLPKTIQQFGAGVAFQTDCLFDGRWRDRTNYREHGLARRADDLGELDLRLPFGLYQPRVDGAVLQL